MGEHGRRHVAKRYSIERLVDDVELLYRELLPWPPKGEQAP